MEVVTSINQVVQIPSLDNHFDTIYKKIKLKIVDQILCWSKGVKLHVSAVYSGKVFCLIIVILSKGSGLHLALCPGLFVCSFYVQN